MDIPITKKRFSKKNIIIFSISFFLILLVFYLVFLKDGKSKLNVDKERITISDVKLGAFQEYISIVGTIEPIQTFYLDLTDGGKIVQKYLEEGSFVKIGDPIVMLDNANLSLQVMNTQSSFLAAESQLNLAQITFEQNRLLKQNQLLEINRNLLIQKREFDANKLLYEKKMISTNEYESIKDDYNYLLKSRDLMLEMLRKDSITNEQLIKQNKDYVVRTRDYLELVKNQLANLTVKAPINGQLTSLNAEIGQNLPAGYKLGRIDNIDSYKVRAEIPEHYVARVYEGQIGSFEFEDLKYNLKIQSVFPQVKNGVFYVDLAFQSEVPKDIRRGQTVHINLELSKTKEALVIDNGGFYSTTGGQWIFVLDPSGSFAEKRQIKIGKQNPLQYEILEGLKNGEKVITSSYENYGDVDKLIIN